MQLTKRAMAKIGITLFLSLFIISFIFLIGGVNSEPIGITGCTNITLSGSYQLTTPITDWNGVTSACMNISASNVILDCIGNNNWIDGIDGANTWAVYVNGSVASKITNVSIINCNFTDWSKAVAYKFVQNSTMKNLSFYSNAFAFAMSTCVNNNVSNIISTSNTQYGGYIETSANYNNFTNIIISSSTLSGFRATGTNSYNLFSYINTSLNTNFGLWLDANSSNNTFLYINSSGNIQDGIRFDNAFYNQVINSTIQGNKQNGIYFYASSFNNITGTTIKNNSVNLFAGLYFYSNSTNFNLNSSYNKVWNNFINNTLNWKSRNENYTNFFNTTAITSKNIAGNSSIGGNYWGDYTGTDANNDGFGDTPYVINATYMNDSLPLKLVIQPPSLVTLTANFTSSIGNIRSDFYGVASNPYFLQTTPAFNRQAFLQSGMKYLRLDISLSAFSTSEGVYDATEMAKKQNLVTWAKANNIKILWIADYMPDWLANNTVGMCSYNRTCPPTNYTKWGNEIVSFLNVVGCDAITCELDVWNEPDLITYWMNTTTPTATNITRSIEYNKLYNATYDAVKAVYPTMQVGGTATTGKDANTNLIMINWMANFSNKIDFVSYHDYLGQGIFTDYHSALEDDYSWILANITFYNINTSRIIISEYNVWSYAIRANETNQWAMELGLAYEVTLNSYPANVSLIQYQFIGNVVNEFQMINDTDDYIYISYNTTKNFAKYCPSGSIVYNSSSDDATVKTVSCKDNTKYNLFIINSDTNSKNATINSTTLIWNLLNYSYQNSNFILNSYDLLALNLNPDKFNLTEGSNTGLLDTNGNEITDDVDNKVWITSSSTSTNTYFGNNLSIPVNATNIVYLPNCNFVDSSFLFYVNGAYQRSYDSGQYTCVNGKVTFEAVNIAPSTDGSLNYLNVTYTVAAGNAGNAPSGGGSPTENITVAPVNVTIPQNNTLTNINNTINNISDSINDALSNVTMNKEQFWMTLAIIIIAAIIISSIFSWKAGAAITIIALAILAIIANQNGLISMG